ncbi:MAG TPA: protein phosphatase 2C domain-containing protein [Albitalea sp.]|uniref:PP2C family protein-serine/threonine phosphatase n=1 Tax=Piscinibacter sp. TaxID=1903157 RepID=UPI002ED360BD
MLDVAVATRSERGQRASNQDKVRVCREGARWVAVLADGAGGHVGGEEASRRAVEHLESALHESAPEFDALSLTQAVLSAHAQVQRAQGDAQGLERMHSTVVVLWIDIDGDRALWSHVGDSRLYHARRGALTLLTADDSVVQRMVDAGLITAEQAELHPQKSQLIAALGIEEDVEPHTVAQALALEEGDAFLLCSDGWWGALDEGFIASTLAEAGTPEEWLTAMQRRIEEIGAPKQDNFSAIGVWVDDPGETTRPMA